MFRLTQIIRTFQSVCVVCVKTKRQPTAYRILIAIYIQYPQRFGLFGAAIGEPATQPIRQRLYRIQKPHLFTCQYLIISILK